MKPESRIRNAIVKRLRAEWPHIWMWCPADRYTEGIPDIVGCVNGFFFGLEVKTAEGRPTRMQVVIGKRIESAGGIFAVVRSPEEAVKVIAYGLMP